ncbi:hypothetical protein E1B28_009646 [Marasmius oreades]|uniref:Uncharacterized protein n=1 Tax=Marasmius oreades TaxID=181124 RepID=A0A9P7RVN3_9AGAR|nr:uncharacterized protein E1B28_009646 [Marasmius oreades]KAG7090537.1 hypothetical protein E1B28_009646 [Marasmius oreades]
MSTVTSDSQFLSLLGKNIMLNVVNLLVAGMLYGVYVILFCMAMVILCRREDNHKARAGLLSAVMAMFVMSSFCFWVDMAIFMAGVQDDLVDDVGQHLTTKHAVYAQKFRILSSVAEVVIPLEIIIGDAIVFWRAWVLCGVNRKIVYIPLLLLAGTTACSFAFLGCFVQNDWPIGNPDTCNLLKISAFSLSMATNMAGTLAISCTLWSYRQALAKYLGNCRSQTQTEKVLVLLLESGIIYSILWIIQLVLVLVSPPPTFAGEVVQQIFVAASVQLVGVYPTLLIVLVYLQRSWWDSSGRSVSSTSRTSAPNSDDLRKSNSTIGIWSES